MRRTLADLLPPSEAEAKAIDQYLADLDEVNRLQANAEARYRGRKIELKAKPPQPVGQSPGEGIPIPKPNQSWFSSLGAKR
jgi:hypothetical protein